VLGLLCRARVELQRAERVSKKGWVWGPVPQVWEEGVAWKESQPAGISVGRISGKPPFGCQRDKTPA